MRHAMALALAAFPSYVQAEAVADVTKPLRGKAAVDSKEFPDLQGQDLVKYLEERLKPRSLRKTSEGVWPIYFYAVFNKEAAAGPITVFIFDQGEKEAIDIKSLKNDAKTWTYRGVIELDENFGFNRGKTYELRIGQLFGKTSKIYAKATVTLE